MRVVALEVEVLFVVELVMVSVFLAELAVEIVVVLEVEVDFVIELVMIVAFVVVMVVVIEVEV